MSGSRLHTNHREDLGAHAAASLAERIMLDRQNIRSEYMFVHHSQTAGHFSEEGTAMRVMTGMPATWKSRLLRQFGMIGLVIMVLSARFAGAAFGQTATGTITGTVTDAQGAAPRNQRTSIYDFGVCERSPFSVSRAE